MAVSYLSTPFESNPYVLPVDLNLLSKVNQYKQSMFYKNAESLKGKLGQLKNTDIINKQQKARLDTAYNNVVTQINDAGAIDYSDMSIVNQVEGLGSQIYDDKYISDGITSTRQIREYMANSEKIKTDPKLNKFYDPAREAYDTEFFMQPYVDGGLDAKYSGPTAPTPYLGNDMDILTKEIQKLKPNITVKKDSFGNDYFWDTETKTQVDRNTILQFVDGKIDGNVADQLKVHAWYNYNKLSGGTYTVEDGVKEVIQPVTENLRLAKLERENIQAMTPTLASDIQAKKDALTTIDSNIKVYEQQLVDVPIRFSQLFKESPISAYYQLYTGKLKNDIANVYSYSQTKSTLTPNLQRLQDDRLNVEAFKQGYRRGFDAQGNPIVVSLKDENGQPVDFGASGKAAKAAKVSTFDANGNLVIDPAYKTLDVNKEEAKDLPKADPASFLTGIETLKTEANSLVFSQIEGFAKEAGVYDEMYSTSTSSNSGTTPVVQSSDLLAYVKTLGDNQTQFEQKDIGLFLDKLKKEGEQYTLKDNNGKSFALTQKGYNFFNVLKNSFDGYASGVIPKEELVAAGLNPTKIQTIVNSYNEVDQEIKAKQKYYNDALVSVGMSPEEIKIYNEYTDYKRTKNTDNPYFAERVDAVYGAPEDGVRYDRTIINTKLGDKADSIIKKYKNDINGKFANTADRFNQFKLSLTNFTGIDENTQLSNHVINLATDLDGNRIENLENVRIEGIRKNDNGRGYILNYAYGTKGTNSTNLPGKPIELSNEIAKKLGGTELPSPWLEESMRYLTESNVYYGSNNSADPLTFKFTISRTGNDRNNPSFGINIFDGDKKVYFQSKQPEFNNTANGAKYFAEQFLKSYNGTNRQEFFQLLNKYKTTN